MATIVTKIDKRDFRIDILRCIAILGIIIGHCALGDFMFQARNFDVVLIVLLLGVSFYLSNAGKEIIYFDYLKKRFNRLIVPTYIFLAIFFAFFYIASLVNREHFYFDKRLIIGSVTLMDGIGYIWIMRLFFIIAMLSPFILKVSDRIKNNNVYFLVLIGAYLIYAGLLIVNTHLHGAAAKLFYTFIILSYGYCLIVALGIRVPLLSKTEIYILGLLFLVTYLTIGYLNHFQNTQDFKYPPRLYYISFSLAISLIGYNLLSIQAVKAMFENAFIRFISKTSAWLYFWHIIPIYLIKLFPGYLIPFSNHAIGRFVFIFGIALLITYLQELIFTGVKWKNEYVTVNNKI